MGTMTHGWMILVLNRFLTPQRAMGTENRRVSERALNRFLTPQRAMGTAFATGICFSINRFLTPQRAMGTYPTLF